MRSEHVAEQMCQQLQAAERQPIVAIQGLQPHGSHLALCLPLMLANLCTGTHTLASCDCVVPDDIWYCYVLGHMRCRCVPQ